MSASRVSLGFFDKAGNPCLTLRLYGVKNVNQEGLECTAIIDTGFTRFIQLPFTLACTLGLPLEGTDDFVLADGSARTLLMVSVLASFAGKDRMGLASITTSSQEILVGLEFLRLFDLGLLVSKKGVALSDETDIPPASPDPSRSTP